jgi:dephospho-CoA kinase
VVLAIDGPAGAGKSTVADRLASELGFFYFDTGVLYRAVAARCLELGVDITDEAALGKRTGKDNGKGKLTFPAVLGASESRQRAARLIDEAIAALTPFAGQAAGLEALARYVLERNH